MSVFKNIKSLFIVEEETSGSKKSATSQAKGPVATPAPGNPIKEESSTGKKGKVTSKFMDVLFDAMQKQNLDGFDYLEYKQSLTSLSKMNMDEATRYQSAYAMAQTMGAKPAKLIDSASHYIRVLQEEEKKFEAALAKQTDTQIASKEQKIKDLDKEVAAKEAEIKKLQQQIKQIRGQQEKLGKEVQSASVKVETTKNNFIASYNTLVSQIHSDLEKMKQYLK